MKKLLKACILKEKGNIRQYPRHGEIFGKKFFEKKVGNQRTK